MSAIAGIYRFDGSKLENAVLSRMIAPLVPHGPDYTGVWAQDSMGLGQCSLWNTPESPFEKYPLLSADGQLVLVADARLDNRAELLRDLSLSHTGTIGDGELILLAYQKWGENCPEKLLGDFAFAIWDARRRALFCARDHFGVKPFYYFESRGFFAFSSEIKAILTLPEIPRKLNDRMMAHHLLWLEENQEITFYEGIYKLSPATTLTVYPGKIQKRKYWSLDARRKTRLQSDQDYSEAFREIFIESVRCRLRSYGKAGSLLSGGLDSSAVTSVARLLLEKEGKALDTFSAIFENAPSSDERVYIRQLTTLPSVRSHEIPLDGSAPFFEIKENFKHLDEVHNYDLTMGWGGIYPEAQKLGVRVLLDGDGGDEVVFRGYLRLAELLKEFRWVEYWKTLNGLSKNIGRSRRDLFISQSVRPLVAPSFLYAWRHLRWGHRALWFERDLLNPVFAKKVGLEEMESQQIREETSPSRSVSEDHFKALTSGSVSYAFGIMAPAAAAFGIEHRYPFHDVRLAEFCLSLPSDQKLYRGWTRVVMRRALEGILPDALRWRGGKTYATDDFVYRLHRFEKEALDRIFLKNPSRIEPYFNLGMIRKKYESFLAKPEYKTAVVLWQAAMLSLWLEDTQFS